MCSSDLADLLAIPAGDDAPLAGEGGEPGADAGTADEAESEAASEAEQG